MGSREIMYSTDRIKDVAAAFRHLSETYKEMINDDMYEYKRAISLSFSEMADIIDDAVACNVATDSISSTELKRIRRYFKALGIIVSDAFMVRRRSNTDELHLRVHMPKGKCITTSELLRNISEYYEMYYLSAKNNKNIVNEEELEYVFYKAPLFSTIVGSACACKEGNGVSGDNFSFLHLNCGKEVVCLIDGCGSGAIANHDSTIAVELLEELLEAGFDEYSAINMINTAFSINKSDGTPVAMDISVIDLYPGVINCIKMGAVSTFILRGGWVEVIKSTTLPIGVFPEVDYDDAVKKLYDGDVVVMVSDGIIEALVGDDKEEIFTRLLATVKWKNPQKIADYILKIAMEFEGGIPIDDMTVLAVLISDVR